VLLNPERPFTAIMGGAKVSDKIQVIENLLNKVDNILIGGGMAYTFVKARGGQVGSSKVEEEMLDTAKGLIEKAKEKNVNLHLPVDNIIADDFSNDANTEVTKIDEVKDGWLGLDIGQDSIKNYAEVIKNSRTILWNGPMGVFEMEKFKQGTVEIAKTVAEATDGGAFSLVGGGDSVAAVNQFNLSNRVTYVSTGGGAMLEYVEGKELPGIKAIRG
jgi:phosphoglycerate kinase